MHLSSDEQVLKTIHHHLFPGVIKSLKIAVISFPFYLMAWFISTGLNVTQSLLMYGIVTALFALIILHTIVIYYLDRLLITNQRVLHIDWKSFTSRKEHEAALSDVQTITTHENGFLSKLAIFDYGTFELETSSTGMVIRFEDAPDPEGIKHFIYHLEQKPSKIESYDQASQKSENTVNQSTLVS